MIYDHGDGWQIHHGDSSLIVPDLGLTGRTVHFVTDPPYAIGLEYGDHPDDYRPDRTFWWMLHQNSGPQSTLHMTVSNRHLPWWLREVEAGSWRYAHASVYWNTGRAGGNANGQFAYAWEPLLSFTKDVPISLSKRMLSDVFRHNGRRSTTHPAERDIGAWRLFMSHLPGGLFVDPFLGSGTTLRAALDLGREAVGIEREKEWCRQAALRCSQMSLFAGDMSSPALVPEQLLEEMER